MMSNIWSALLLMLVAIGPASAQDRIRIDERRSCTTCLSMSQIAVLGRGPTLLNGLSRIARDSEGRYVVANSYDGPLVLFDGQGNELRTFGRAGQGPGEFNYISQLLVLPADTILVLEGPRASILAPALEGYVRTHHTPLRAFTSQAMGDGRVALGANPAAGGAPFVLWDPRTGEPSTAPARPAHADPYRNVWTMAASSSGETIWAANPNEYEIRHYSSTGEHLATVVRDADWFPEWDGNREMRPDGTSRAPTLASIHAGSDGLLYTMIRVLQPEARSIPVLPEQPAAQRILNDTHDTIIEVLDPASGRLVAELRTDVALGGLIPGDEPIVYGMLEAPDGSFLVHIWRLALTSRN